MRRLPFLLIALALTAAASAQPQDGDFGPATMVIEYQDGHDLLRPATLSLTPTGENAKPFPRGAVDEVAVLSRTGQWVTIDRLLSSGHQTGVQAEAMLPAPDAILMILIKSARGPWRGWRVANERYANLEVSYFDQRGRRVESGPCEPRACFAHVVDHFNQSETLASSFKMGIIMMEEGEEI